MELGQISVILTDVVKEHWAEIAFSIAGLALGGWWGRRRAARQWAKKEFKHRINVSLNILTEGRLLIRTLMETDLDSIFLNKVAVAKVLAAAEKTSEADPLLPLDPEDSWFLLNAVLNEVSEQFAEGHIRRDMGLPVTTTRYLVALTYECDGKIRTRKVRAMVVKKESLLNLASDVSELESPNHKTRFRTLQKLADHYRKTPHQFLEVEISL